MPEFSNTPQKTGDRSLARNYGWFGSPLAATVIAWVAAFAAMVIPFLGSVASFVRSAASFAQLIAAFA